MEPQDTRFRSKNAHKNTSVFIGDNIKEPFVFQYSFYCIFPRKKPGNSDKDEDRKTIGVDHVGGGGG